MHQLGSLIVELETARRKLQNVFEAQNGTATSEEKTRRILNGSGSIGSFLRPRSSVGHSSIKPIGFFPATVDPIAAAKPCLNEGVERIFAVPGEENLDILESLRRESLGLRPISANLNF